MYPSKSMVDYMSEMNRLFPRTNENDMHATSSLFNQSATANRSSSSADSTSLESFLDISTPFRGDFRPSDTSIPESPQHYYEPPRPQDSPRLYESPRDQFMIRRQRPIVGRKILANSDVPISPIAKSEPEGSLWHPEDAMFFQQTPPSVNKIFTEQQNYTQNVIYELFPADNKAGFKTPVKATVSPSVSPTLSNFSPTSRFNSSPVPQLPRNFPSPPFNMNSSPTLAPSTSRYHQDIRPTLMCTFCRKNGETPFVYLGHMVKEKVGNKHVVTCPILRLHVCSTCNATGDDAHTMTYCPVLRSGNNGVPLRSTTITLKNTRIKSNGRRRY